MSFKETYIQYCLNNEIPLFFQPFWLDESNHSWDVCYAAINGYQAYFIYHNEKKLGLTFLRSPHLIPYTGLLFVQDQMPEEYKRNLVHSLLNQLPSFDVFDMDLAWQIGIQLHFPTFDISLRRTNLITLYDEATVYSQLMPSLKRQIMKANRSLTVFEEDNIDLFYLLHQKTFLKQNKQPQIPLDVYQGYWHCCKQHGCGKLFFIKDNDEHIHAAMFIVYDHNIAYYLAGGTDADYNGSGAMSLLMWHAILISIRMEKKTFDFEGSMLPNVNRFFRNFNPVEVQYLHLNKVNSILYKILKG